MIGIVADNATNLSDVSDVMVQTITIIPTMLQLMISIIPIMIIMPVIGFVIHIFSALAGVERDDYPRREPSTYSEPKYVRPPKVERPKSVLKTQPVLKTIPTPTPKIVLATAYPGKDMLDLRGVYKFEETAKKQSIGLKLKVIRKLRRWANS